MKVVRGLIHEFLGMDIEFKRGKEKGKISIGIKKHILKGLDMFLDDITRCGDSSNSIPIQESRS